MLRCVYAAGPRKVRPFVAACFGPERPRCSSPAFWLGRADYTPTRATVTATTRVIDGENGGPRAQSDPGGTAMQNEDADDDGDVSCPICKSTGGCDWSAPLLRRHVQPGRWRRRRAVRLRPNRGEGVREDTEGRQGSGPARLADRSASEPTPSRRTRSCRSSGRRFVRGEPHGAPHPGGSTNRRATAPAGGSQIGSTPAGSGSACT